MRQHILPLTLGPELIPLHQKISTHDVRRGPTLSASAATVAACTAPPSPLLNERRLSRRLHSA
eukprot:4612729-Pleurochrysis_carterae.AAC.1